MKLKKLLLLTCIAILTLTGCSDTSDVDALRNMEALNTQTASKKNYSLSMTDEQTIVYQQVADRTLLDLSMLNACSEDEIQQVVAYMNNVDAQLVGQVSKEDGSIDSCFTDYLLTEFEKTPYYWQRTNTTIRGIDAESRSIIVDVTYKTIDFDKNVQNKSPLVLGEPLYNDKILNQVKSNKSINKNANEIVNITHQSNNNNNTNYTLLSTDYGTRKFTFGLCLPSGCNATEYRSVIFLTLKNIAFLFTIDNPNQIDLLQLEDYSIQKDTNMNKQFFIELIPLGVFLLFTLIIIFGFFPFCIYKYFFKNPNYSRLDGDDKSTNRSQMGKKKESSKLDASLPNNPNTSNFSNGGNLSVFSSEHYSKKT